MNKIKEEIAAWKKSGEKIIFTNGVFDILHRGHVTYLNEAKKLGNRLVIGLNSDASVRRLNKGPERPINDEDSRAFVLSNLKAVDLVIIFSEDTPFQIIEDIQPDVLVKGGDYDPKETDRNSKKYIVGSDIVKKNGGVVMAIDLVQGFSTTGIVQKLRD